MVPIAIIVVGVVVLILVGTRAVFKARRRYQRYWAEKKKRQTAEREGDMGTTVAFVPVCLEV